jgi:hypothetical protein
VHPCQVQHVQQIRQWCCWHDDDYLRGCDAEITPKQYSFSVILLLNSSAAILMAEIPEMALIDCITESNHVSSLFVQ